VAVRCRLAPLRSDEVALYINSRLQTVGYESKELFDLGSVQKIALHSKGIPRLINVICDNALLIAYATSKSTVSTKIIDDVARDLQLIEPSQVKGVEQPKEVSRPAKASHDDESLRADFEPKPPSSQLQPKSSWAGVGIGVMLMIVILAGTVLYSRQSGSLGINLEDLVRASWKNPIQAQSKPTPERLREKFPAKERVDESPVQEPFLEEPKLSASDMNQRDALNPRRENAVQSDLTKAQSKRESPGTSLTQTRTAKTRTRIENHFYYDNDAAREAEKLEFEIHKAIQNRAIRGVEVSVRDGKIYLTGQVATEKQKIAAAQSARSVAGVKEVRDQITVHSLYSPD
jgi:BON domain